MKIQLAIDRVTLEKAKEILAATAYYVDIVEVGTSLIKDYGTTSIKELKAQFPDKTVLADIKTMDEGAYEFRAAYNNGADIATVMGAASLDTIRACYEVAKEYNKLIMIDLLEVNDDKISTLKIFEDALFCIHLSTDSARGDLVSLIREFKYKHPEIKDIAVAGGVNLTTAGLLKELDIAIAVIGGAITKAKDMAASARSFREVL